MTEPDTEPVPLPEPVPDPESPYDDHDLSKPIVIEPPFTEFDGMSPPDPPMEP